ncbi:MAG TPA: acyltransferase [Steroidobacteraceae bacterium]|nr:acyltransferase [Steroidobacteraceae bacterium]
MGILEWAHRRETPAQRRAWELIKAAARIGFPTVPGLHRLLLAERRFRRGPLHLLWNKVYREPLLRLQCEQVGKGLVLFEGIPKIMGNLRVTLGARVKLNGEHVWIASGDGRPRTLEVGDDSGIGFGAEIIVGDSIKIGQHVMIANHVTLVGYDGHPLDPFARARSEPPGPEGVGPIEVKDYAWIGSHSIIMKGVTVGRGAVVAMGSVVKFSVPDLTVVSGNPAKVVWQIAPPEGW